MRGLALLTALALSIASGGSYAQNSKHYDPGASDTEIKLGQTVPYSGPVSSSSALGKGAMAYLQMVNDRGGINGRKVTLISLDDAYSPPKAFEQARKLVEEDGVLAMVGSNGSPTGVAQQAYLNKKGVPQLLQVSGSRKFNDPKQNPWSTGFFSTFYTEGEILAHFVLKRWPNARIAILHPADELGREYLAGFRNGLGARADSMIVKVVSYDTTSPTVDSQMAQLASSGADLFFDAALTKFASQSIRQAREMAWKTQIIVPSISGSIGAILKPAGLDNAKDIFSGIWLKDASDPAWRNDKGVQDYLEFLHKYLPGVNPDESSYGAGYTIGQIIETILRNCGDELTRQNVLKQATTLRNMELPLGLTGVKYENSPEDYNLIRSIQMVQFDGQKWVPLSGELVKN